MRATQRMQIFKEIDTSYDIIHYSQLVANNISTK